MNLEAVINSSQGGCRWLVQSGGDTISSSNRGSDKGQRWSRQCPGGPTPAVYESTQVHRTKVTFLLRGSWRSPRSSVSTNSVPEDRL